MANLGAIIKSIRDIMREDRGINGDAQRLEQLGWMLFLKIFDDKDLESELLDENYKSPIPKKYQWRNWAADSEGITGDKLQMFIDQELFPELRNLTITSKHKKALLVREVFQGNNNYMKSGINIRKVCNKLSEIDFNAREERHLFGEIYETILKELQSAGSSGEFYTPRAVTQFITEMVNPSIEDVVLDPACGTGGFLTCAIEHIRKKGVRSVEDRKLLQENIRGWEYKPLPYVLGVTNLILHDIEEPEITYEDTLSKEYTSIREKDRVTVILANPPFGSTVSNGNENNFPLNYRNKESADLFLLLFINLLKDKGRAGIVLPDGSLTGEGVKQRIRQKLLEECNVHTIIRLPDTVFKPYAQVPTNILFFEKGSPTEEIWYFEHRLPIGQKAYSKTKPIQLNDFDSIKLWWNNRVESEVSWKVGLDDIIERSYDLDISNPFKKQINFGNPDEINKSFKKLENDIDEQQNVLLNRLNGALSSPKLIFFSKNFKTLTSIPENVIALDKVILKLGISGELTSEWRMENTNESASELLKMLKNRKNAHNNDNGIREKPLQSIKDSEIPFKLPPNWVFCKLGEIITLTYGSSLTKSQTSPLGKYPVYGSNGIVGHYNSFLTEKRSIIVGRKGSSGALNISELPSWTTDVAYYIEETDFIDFKFLYFLLLSLELPKLGKGIKPGLNRNEFYNLVIGLPPLNEQKEIVSKLEELKGISSELITKIRDKNPKLNLLMHAVLQGAFSY
jgi:type I restriction enzyme M protein